MKWKILSSEYICNHIYFTARRDRCQREDGKIVDPYFVVELPVSATALAITDDNRIVMVKQYRHPLDEVMLETPGGFVDTGESMTEGMKRELLEETGYVFTKVEHLGRVAANPGVLNNYTELFIATGGRKVNTQQLDHNEEIEIVLFSPGEIIDMLKKNEIKQSLHVNCIFYALMHLGKLTIQP